MKKDLRTKKKHVVNQQSWISAPSFVLRVIESWIYGGVRHLTKNGRGAEEPIRRQPFDGPCYWNHTSCQIDIMFSQYQERREGVQAVSRWIDRQLRSRYFQSALAMHMQTLHDSSI